jgi:hypothetical protein
MEKFVFPQDRRVSLGDGDDYSVREGGMTLREYAAVHLYGYMWGEIETHERARLAIEHAEALVAELSRPPAETPATSSGLPGEDTP